MLLISYDGSPDSRAAIARAAEMSPGAEATVLTVWEPFSDTLARTGTAGLAMGMSSSLETEKIDEASLNSATTCAAEGAVLANAAGLSAHPATEKRQHGVGHTILATARSLDASAIVMGTRGLSGLKSFLLGSVSHQVTQHADRPVLIVPASPPSGRHLTAVGSSEATS